MKTNDIKLLHTTEVKDLQTKLEELVKQLTSVRMEHMLGRLKNTQSLRFLRRDIARVQTVLKNKEISE
jgi:large subunit ribosomal protein L29